LVTRVMENARCVHLAIELSKDNLSAPDAPLELPLPLAPLSVRNVHRGNGPVRRTGYAINVQPGSSRLSIRPPFVMVASQGPTRKRPPRPAATARSAPSISASWRRIAPLVSMANTPNRVRPFVPTVQVVVISKLVFVQEDPAMYAPLERGHMPVPRVASPVPMGDTIPNQTIASATIALSGRK
jgi:hypothetical protein